MRPILLQGHERALTQIKYNREGDLLFSVAKDNVINVWFSHNGERLGTYNGHQGSIWSVDVNSDSSLLISGSADNTARLWNVADGRLLHTWTSNTAVKRVQFSEDDKYVLMVTEQRMGFPGTILIFAVDPTTADQSDEPLNVIIPEPSKATVAGWGYLNKYIVVGHENGNVSLFDWNTGEVLKCVEDHEAIISDLQFSTDRTYFITSSKDKTARIYDSNTLECIKSYPTDTPLNSAVIVPAIKEFVVVGGGQEAMQVTTTSQRQGKFECRFFHKIHEDEVGRVRGHFGPINTIAFHPDGKSFSSGGEDGYVRVHHFDPDYYTFKYE
ncbi:translation initiation factor eIF3 subunit [Dimargaris cristalligena]|uniref:Eukaryotic translation initiation factor 3 subunit I n=1 Tax=Dimargaris cristalligena TaxID=215637 RepID=A0A4P9ZPD9_9FUNG|nr:translation initiation factor eIF3 subunit [Dimargaris cristalligena]RKP34210.1 WD40-repeat-containing domain protein [Dimargaris cristalligena]|eukprot:RKP34210.1 WD40-repeat-containing domain protein [Dimargaris cristalligena]